MAAAAMQPVSGTMSTYRTSILTSATYRELFRYWKEDNSFQAIYDYTPDGNSFYSGRPINVTIGKYSREAGSFSHCALACIRAAGDVKQEQFFKLMNYKVNFETVGLVCADARVGGEIEGLRLGMTQAGIFCQLSEGFESREEILPVRVTADKVDDFIRAVRATGSEWILLGVLDKWENNSRISTVNCGQAFVLGQTGTRIKFGEGKQVVLADTKEYLKVCCFVIYQILLQLHSMHEIGAFHRDLKPGNTLISIDWSKIETKEFYTASEVIDALSVRIIDAGNVKIVEGVEGQTGSFRRDRRASIHVGTAQYSAPELILARKDKDAKYTEYDGAVDIWSLGNMFLSLSIGMLPFGTRYEQLMYIHEVYQAYKRENPDANALKFLEFYWSDCAKKPDADPSKILQGKVDDAAQLYPLLSFVNDTLDFDERLSTAELIEKYRTWNLGEMRFAEFITPPLKSIATDIGAIPAAVLVEGDGEMITYTTASTSVTPDPTAVPTRFGGAAEAK